MICPKYDNYYRAAEKIYQGDLDAIYNDFMSNGNQWSKKVREAAGETILDDLDEETVPGNNYINLSIDKRKNIITNINIEKERYENLLDKDPDNESVAKRVAYLQKMLKDSAIISDELLVLSYINYSDVSIKKSLKALDEIEKNLEYEDIGKVMRLAQQLDNLEVLKDVEIKFNDTEEGRQAQEVYRDLLESKDTVHKRILEAVRNIWANDLANNPNNTVYVQARADAEKLFNKNNKDNAFESRAAKREARQEFIEQYLADNASHIKMKALSYYGNYVRNIQSDIGQFEVFSPNTFVNESIFSSIVNDILLDLEVAKTEVEAESQVMEDLFNDVKSEVSGSTAFEVWQDMLIKDKRGWRLLNPKSKNTYLRKKAERESGKSVAPYTQEELKWKALLAKPNLERAYNKFVDMLKKSDYNFTSNGKLGLYIPTLQQDVYKKIAQGGLSGIWSSIKEIGTINEKFQDIVGSDVTAYTRMDDKVVMGVPVYMRAKDLKDNEMNFDLPTLLMMNLYNSKVFAARLKNKELIDSAQFMVAGGRVAYSGFEATRKKMLNQDGQQAYQEDSSQSNLYKRLQDLKESMIFGKGVKAGKGLTNVVQKANIISSIINLSGNAIAGAASFGNNLFQNLEARISDSDIFSKGSASKARTKYFKYMSGQIKDYAEGKTPKSFLGHLYNFYNPGLESFDTKFKSDYDSLLSRHANMSSLFIMQRASDTPAYSIVMMSYLESTYATNDKGQLVNSEGTVVTKTSDAMTLMEAYEKHYSDTGKIGFPDFVKGNNRTGENTTRNLKKLGRAIQNFSSERFGAYGSLNKAAAARHPLGSLFYSQRGFLIPLLLQKWKGGSVVVDKRYLYDIPMSERHVDETRGVTTEGTYVIGMKVIWDTLRGVKAAGGLLASRSNMLGNISSRDLAQFRRMQAEVALLATLYIIASSLRGYGEDEDDELALMAAFYTRRIYAELRSPSSPQELLRYFQQPTVSSGTLERLVNLSTQAFKDMYNVAIQGEEFEKYESGLYKGETKLKRQAIKLTPVLNQINRNYDWKKMYDYLDKM